MSKIRIGTLGNQLSLVETNRVIKELETEGVESELITVENLDHAILESKVDAVVYQMQDFPLSYPDSVSIAAVLKRDPPFDFLVVDKPLEEVYNIGTSSLRCRAQLLRYYHKSPEMKITPINGNVEERLKKLYDGYYDAIILPEEVLKRLGCMVHGFRLPADAFVPSPNQGAIAVISTKEMKNHFSSLHHVSTAYDISVERAVMRELGDISSTPVGIYSQGGKVLGEVLSLDGVKAVRVESDVPCIEAASAIGKALKEKAECHLNDENND